MDTLKLVTIYVTTGENYDLTIVHKVYLRRMTVQGRPTHEENDSNDGIQKKMKENNPFG